MNFLRQFARNHPNKSILNVSQIASNAVSVRLNHKFLLSEPSFDEKLKDPKNISEIDKNIKIRKGVGDIHLVHDIINKLSDVNLSSSEKINQQKLLQDELKKIPNNTHPDVIDYGEHPKLVSYFNEKPKFKHNLLEFSEICKKLNLLRTDYLGNFSGHKSYYLMSDLAELVNIIVEN